MQNHKKMSSKANSLLKFPNLYFYSEAVKSRSIKKATIIRKAKPKIVSKIPENSLLNSNISDRIDLSQETTTFLNELNQSKLSLNLKTNGILDVTSKNLINFNEGSKLKLKNPKKYLEILREIEEKAIESYENMKQITRSKSVNITKLKENPRGFKLKAIRESYNEDSYDNIESNITKNEDFYKDSQFKCYDLDLMKKKLKKKIQNELLIPITDHSKIDKEKIKKEILKKESIGKLKKNKTLNSVIEDILGRERHFYLRKMEDFFKKEKIDF